EGEGEFTLPYGLDVDIEGNVWVADRGSNCIQKFDINGDFIKSFGTEGNQSGQFNLPTSVIIDSHGDLYINERGNERI
ncbi:MAG: 6-bladed beta-propeller, partial [Nitrososphaeraceae archaeon]